MLKNVLLIAAMAVGSLSFGYSNSNNHNHVHSINSSASVQCEGTTKAGARCKRKVANDTYCYQHISQKPKK